MLLLAITGFVCVAAFVDKVFGSKRDFAEFRDQITIVDSSSSHRVAGSNHLVTVIGTLTNLSNFPWDNLAMEVRYFNSKGELIDTASRVAQYDSTVIAPHGEIAFKIEGKAVRPESEYASHRVSVLWAKDVREWP